MRVREESEGQLPVFVIGGRWRNRSNVLYSIHCSPHCKRYRGDVYENKSAQTAEVGKKWGFPVAHCVAFDKRVLKAAGDAAAGNDINLTSVDKTAQESLTPPSFDRRVVLVTIERLPSPRGKPPIGTVLIPPKGNWDEN
ncbi:hypothetical protein F2P81_004120 [Scophthalmus maximus]|uniref:Uncharacterized protein n=1 Tax=Scophthalmus maximus TaxID=52904 RepID=A0A6A4T9N0_SCOMX|nr:hypothetical protein F2P81_004120 [Scophthalmus maximus]